jgi:hypothetical protein
LLQHGLLLARVLVEARPEPVDPGDDILPALAREIGEQAQALLQILDPSVELSADEVRDLLEPGAEAVDPGDDILPALAREVGEHAQALLSA